MHRGFCRLFPSESGCQSVVEADGVRVLYLACQETIDCREVESLIYMASIIMRKCFPRSHLPLHSLKNPLVFHLPVDDLLENSDSADLTQSTTPTMNPLNILNCFSIFQRYCIVSHINNYKVFLPI